MPSMPEIYKFFHNYDLYHNNSDESLMKIHFWGFPQSLMGCLSSILQPLCSLLRRPRQ